MEEETTEEVEYQPERNEKGQFMPGSSGFPGGRSRRGESFADIITKLLSTDDLDGIDMSALCEKEKLMVVLIKKAKSADLKAIEMVINRLDGTPVQVQKIDLTANRSPFEVFNGERDKEL